MIDSERITTSFIIAIVITLGLIAFSFVASKTLDNPIWGIIILLIVLGSLTINIYLLLSVIYLEDAILRDSRRSERKEQEFPRIVLIIIIIIIILFLFMELNN